MSSLQNISLPGPTITPVSKPFWDSVAAGKLSIQQCNSCQEWVFYPREHCPHCLSDDLTWKEASGSGSLKTWSVIHRAGHPAWQDRTPYVVGIVELEEGPSLLTHLLVKEEDLAYKMKVKVSFEVIENHTLPFFTKEETQ
ncbi:OB-fold domain-containing protein [Gracilibacillus sp. YIM 98692]|uniref:Zn-ribbon domain-containing OB-fold protein n=1 Tax=Gracilibacillus sp. YIM 98692 TaxID=2663532 RepID=UPI0013D5307D|nr:OB-fold domain-containing protein [Gracilibacillus sp. YIM 98692]